MKDVWGPASPLAVAFEDDQREAMRRQAERMSIYLYGGGPIVLSYQTPTYVLRRRAMYGGRKGRAAIRRLKAAGCRPLTRASQQGGDSNG